MFRPWKAHQKQLSMSYIFIKTFYVDVSSLDQRPHQGYAAITISRKSNETEKLNSLPEIKVVSIIKSMSKSSVSLMMLLIEV